MIRPFQWQSLLLPVSSIILFPVSFRFLFNYVLFNIISVISVLFEWPHGGLGFDLTDSTFFWWLSFAPFFFLMFIIPYHYDVIMQDPSSL